MENAIEMKCPACAWHGPVDHCTQDLEFDGDIRLECPICGSRCEKYDHTTQSHIE